MKKIEKKSKRQHPENAIKSEKKDTNELWKIIISDDDDEIHKITRMVLKGYNFKGRKVQLLSAYTGSETKKLLEENPETAMILLDVVMETEDAGLRIVDYIRKSLGNNIIQIVLRTGQAGQAPEQKVVEKYDINDYKSKHELTAQKLFTTVTSSLRAYELARSYHDIVERLNRELDEREKAENRVRELSHFQESIIENATLWINVIDKDNRVFLWNRAAEKISGYSREEVLGNNEIWQKLYPDPETLEDELSVFREILTKSKSVDQNYERKIIRKDGSYAAIEWHAQYLKDSFNSRPGILLVGEDISEKQFLEIQLRQAQKMESVGTLAGGLAHDFNNVLGGMIGTISLMKYVMGSESGATHDEIIGYLNIMEESGHRATEIVKQLMALSRKQEMSFKAVSLSDIVSQVVHILKSSIDKSVTIKIDYPDPRPMVYADQIQIEQALLNICLNAAHSMTMMKDNRDDWGGDLTIVIDLVHSDNVFKKRHPGIIGEEFWRIQIKDTGIGMNPEVMGKIFDPFFTTKPKGSGTGLGLAMVYSIIKQHSGFIDVYSQTGRGSLFSVYFPVIKIKHQTYDKTKDASIISGEGLVLVVEDEKMIRNTIQAILDRCGYKVIVAENGAQGIELFEKNREKLRAVVLDMNMPGMSGRETFINMQEIDDSIPVLLASGYAKDEQVEQLFNLGIKGFIQKPYTIERLSQAVGSVLKKVK